VALTLRKTWSTEDPAQLQEELQELQRSVSDELARLGARARVRAETQDSVFANYGDLVRLDPPTGGLVLTLPPATPAVAGSSVEAVITSADGSVTVQVVDGLIDGEEEIVLSPRIGRARFTCDGAQWFHGVANALGSVSLAELEAIAPGRSLGLQVDAVGAASPVPLTGAEQGENIRYGNTQEFLAVAPGDYTSASFGTTLAAIDPTVSTLHISATGAGLINIHGLPEKDGKRYVIKKRSALGTIVFKHDSGTEGTAGARIEGPGNADFTLDSTNDSVLLEDQFGRWRPINLKSVTSILAAVYPVGSLYFSTNSTNPATSLGFGTWSAFGAGRVPVGFDSGQTEFDTDEETGGAKTVAAAGTNSAPTFTGSALGTHTHGFTGNALATHAHELPIGNPGATPQFNLTSFGTGASRARTRNITNAAPTAGNTAAELSQAVSAGTPSGTNASVSAGTPSGTVSAPTFTGSATSVLQPYIVVRMWKRTA
jgi:hypothetical protein